jgi:hypothetical protein
MVPHTFLLQRSLKRYTDKLLIQDVSEGNVARMGEKRNVYMLLVGKPERKRPLERPRRRWIDNIKMDLSEIGLSFVDWVGLAHDRCS